jgi:hypothetical protein
MRAPRFQLLILCLAGLTACGESGSAPAVAPSATDSGPREESAPDDGGEQASPDLAPHVDALLEVCIDAASKFPLNPHIKNRSRAQEKVVQAAFTLGDLERGLRYTNRIENWRRGACYADYAFHLAEGGDSPVIQEHLEKAAQWIETGEDADWRTYSIKVKIARTHERLGQLEAAQAILAGLPPQAAAERAEYEAERSRHLGEEEFDARLSWVDASTRQGTLDDVKMAFAGLTTLYERFYPDADRRGRIEAAMRDARAKAPLDITLDAFDGLARIALAAGDREHALELSREVSELIASVEWLPEDEIARASTAAELRFLAGDEEGGRAELDRLRGLFERKREVIYDIYRADALTPLAAAYARIGDLEGARETYALALEESVRNPNSRPRVDDLVLICLSMIETGFEPSAELLARIREISAGLGDPW